MTTLRHRLQKWLVTIGVFVAGGAVGWLLPIDSPLTSQRILNNRGEILRQQDTGSYQFIDPLLACDIGTEDAFPEFAPIKQKLENLIDQEESSDSIDSVSVYARSMKGGRWFEINGDTIYAPASLLKVFVMMAYYKEAEDTSKATDASYSGILERQIVFEGSPDPAADDPGEVIPHLVSGKSYSVSQVIDQMIVYSDNDAMNTLLDNFHPQTLTALKEIFADLNIPSPLTVNESTLNFMPVGDYAMVFRVLYGATYLSRDDSERALKLLSQAHYADGIVAGVPKGVTVAHKFGDTTVSNDNGGTTDELHDCGVVYLPNHPYLLCVMTKGSSFSSQQTAIQDISRATYQSLSAFYAGAKPAAATSTVTTRK